MSVSQFIRVCRYAGATLLYPNVGNAADGGSTIAPVDGIAVVVVHIMEITTYGKRILPFGIALYVKASVIPGFPVAMKCKTGE